ncbi:tail tape measure protein [Halorubrum tailed virus 25]|uniref:Tail tape measure protein n=1 Tax=Halorubrum tailed virus 25 TaxID=2878006 RepID=A0AAE9BYV2_9CAUD|nr:tail length tape measure protein [Halorubrum tailed virus 25]UBF22608.1 tail tape measure protein [Halorubrum tailed virus 25]
MANSDPVRVAVEIIDQFTDDLSELETRLEKIDGKTLDVDLDIDTGRLEEVEARLDALEEDINTTLKIKTRGYSKAKAQKEDLDGDMYSTLHLLTDKDQIRGLGNLSGGEGFNPPEAEAFARQWSARDSLGQQNLLSLIQKEGGLTGLAGMEGLDLADDVLDHTIENLRGFEGSSSEYADSVRRFSPEEQDFINDWIINPDVARAHNRGIPKGDRDGWIGPSNWAFGMGEKWGPDPRYPGDKKPLDPSTDFLRGVKEMTDSWSDLEGRGLDVDFDASRFPLNTGLGDSDSDRTAPEIDFLRSINRAGDVDIGEAVFNGGRFGDLPFQARGMDPDLFFPNGRGGGNYPWSFAQRAGRRAGRGYARVRHGLSGAGSRISSVMPSGTDLDSSQFFGQRQFKGIGEKLKSVLPTDMRKWYRLIAMLLPMLIALAGAAVGLVAAFGALATAGVAMMGIGLLGWGDSLEESMRNVRREVSELKNELFEVLRPAANAFQPFTAQLFDNAPKMVEALVEPLQELVETGYDTWWLESLQGASEWFADLLWAASDLAPQIQAIGTAFGTAFGTWLIDFLTRMTSEVYENWEMWTKLTRSFLTILNIIYELSKVLAFLVAILEPFITLLGGIADLIGNDVLSAILAAVAAMWALDFVLAAIAGKGIFAMLSGWIAGLMGVSGAAGVLNAMLAGLAGMLDFIIGKLTLVNLLTGGLLALTGAVIGYGAYKAISGSGTASDSVGGKNVPARRGGGTPAGAGGNTVNITFNGDVGRREYQRLRDEFPEYYEDAKETDTKTQK